MNIQIDILDKLTSEIIEEMKHIWFVADLHAQHPKIVDICNRPISREEHDEWLLKEVFNKYVQKKDEVYILGDISLGKRKDAEKWVARMNGNKHLILGNHDKNVRNLGNWAEVTQIKDFTFSRYGLNIHIVLAHYPIASWNRKIHGSWHLYGHVHGRFENSGLSYDVGIDNQCNKYGVFHWLRPINLYEIILIMNERQKQGLDKDYTKTSIEAEEEN
jgi:calcineurin-like phosphoesterase family protein